MPAQPSPPPGINLDEAARPHHTLSSEEITAIAKRCEDRQAQGIMFAPSSVPLIVEALRALARQRARR